MRTLPARGEQRARALSGLTITLVLGGIAGGMLASIEPAHQVVMLLAVPAGVTALVFYLGGPTCRTYESIPVWILGATIGYVGAFVPRSLAGKYYPALAGRPSQRGVELAMLCAVVSVAAIVLGWRTGKVGSPVSPRMQAPRPIVYWRLQALSLIVFGASIRLAGIPLSDALSTISTTGYSDRRATSVIGFVSLFGTVGLVVTPLLLLADAWLLRSRAAKLLASANFVAILGLDLLLGVRFRAFLLVGALLLLWRQMGPAVNRSRRSALAIGFASISLLGIFTIASVRVGQLRSQSSLPAPKTQLLPSEVDLLTPAAAAVDGVAKRGLLFGRSYFDVALQSVPRIIWPKKPEPATIGFIKGISDPRAGMAIPLYSEMYINFGIIGVAMLSFMLAKWARRAVSRWADDPNPYAHVALALAPPVAVQAFSRGYAFQTAYTIAYLYVPLVLLRRVMTRRSTAASSSV